MYSYIEIESMNPTEEMLAACLEQKIQFKAFFENATLVVLTDLDGWTVLRGKGNEESSRFHIPYEVKPGILADETHKFSADPLVNSVIRAKARIGVRVDSRKLLLSLIPIFGGPVSQLRRVLQLK